MGRFWLAALRLTVVPLIISQTLVAVAGTRSGSIGALGAKAVGLFVCMLAAGGVFAVLVAPPLLALYHVNPEMAAGLRASTMIPAPMAEMAGRGVTSFGDWLVALVPESISAALSGREILPVLLVTLVFGFAVTRLPDDRRALLGRGFEGVAEAMMVVVRWILVLTPLGVFALAFQMSLHAGGEVSGVLFAYAALASGMLLAVTAMLYPATAILGRVSLRRFAAAVAPAQLVAVATRSSLAALPALIEGARDVLRLPASATGFLLPLAVSTFKLNPTVSSTAKLLFLSHVFSVPLSTASLVTFILTVLLMSFSSPGLPAGSGGMTRLPAYLAAGMPIEGVVILSVVEPIPDIFKTIANVTADMSAATILTRS